MTLEEFKEKYKDEIPTWLERRAKRFGWPEKLSPHTIEKQTRLIYAFVKQGHILGGECNPGSKTMKGMLHE